MFPILILPLSAKYSEYLAQDKYINKAKIIRLIKSEEVPHLFEIFDTEGFLACLSYLLIRNNNACLMNQSVKYHFYVSSAVLTL